MVTSELHTFHLNWKNRNWVTTQRERRKSIKLPLLHCILHLPFGICLPKKQLLKGRKKTFNVYHVHTDLICLQREKANTTIFLSLEIGHKGFFFTERFIQKHYEDLRESTDEPPGGSTASCFSPKRAEAVSSSVWSDSTSCFKNRRQEIPKQQVPKGKPHPTGTGV